MQPNGLTRPCLERRRSWTTLFKLLIISVGFHVFGLQVCVLGRLLLTSVCNSRFPLEKMEEILHWIAFACLQCQLHLFLNPLTAARLIRPRGQIMPVGTNNILMHHREPLGTTRASKYHKMCCRSARSRDFLCHHYPACCGVIT